MEEGWFNLFCAIYGMAAHDYLKASKYIKGHAKESRALSDAKIRYDECKWFLGEECCKALDRVGRTSDKVHFYDYACNG